MPELRKDPVVGRWVIISTDRAKRPSDFLRSKVTQKGGFCPLCPGNESKTPSEVLAYRPEANGDGQKNGPGWSVRVVPNKFPALGIEGTPNRRAEGMFDKMNGLGAHEVIIESPEHSSHLALMSTKNIENVLWAWRDRIVDLKQDRRFKYILIFKNHGEAAGATLEHPHAQLIALPIVPKRVQEELDGSRQYFTMKERCIFCDMLRQELEHPIRIVSENDDFVTFEPFAPRFPFESWILPRRHESSFENISSHQMIHLASAMKQLLLKFEHSLDSPAYNFALHTAPVQDGSLEYYHWHIEFIPKLTSMAGFEWGTGFYINPTPPEESAKFLREAAVPGEHLQRVK